MDLPSATVVSAVQSRCRTSKSPETQDGDTRGVGDRGPKGIMGVASNPPAPFLPYPLCPPVAAVSKSGLSKTPSRKKKNRRGPVIKITEMSEKYHSQESEASE